MTPNLRYEKKMIFESLRLSEVRSWVYAHSDAFHVAYPPRQVNNIYFDTVERSLMMDHVNGVANRSKLRFRWYGESWLIQEGQLEIKKKTGDVGYKIIQLIKSPIDLSNHKWRDVIRLLKSELNKENASLVTGHPPSSHVGRNGISTGDLPNRPTWESERLSPLLDTMMPVLINQYHREYYESADKKIRVTLDYDICAFAQSFGFSPNITFPQPAMNNVIIEMKSAQENHQRMADSLAEFPLRCLQNSKYLNAMEFMV